MSRHVFRMFETPGTGEVPEHCDDLVCDKGAYGGRVDHPLRTSRLRG